MAYRFAVIDTATELWDPPPPRPSLAPAWIGASLSSAMILALLAAGGVVAHAWNDERYRETADTCSRLDITAVATRLGDPTLRPQPSRTPGACAYVVQDENGLWNGYGSVQVDYTPNAVGAWLAWRNRQAEDNPQQVPNLGRAARLTTQARNVRGQNEGNPDFGSLPKTEQPGVPIERSYVVVEVGQLYEAGKVYPAGAAAQYAQAVSDQQWCTVQGISTSLFPRSARAFNDASSLLATRLRQTAEGLTTAAESLPDTARGVLGSAIQRAPPRWA
jgi:hypothetical protein